MPEGYCPRCGSRLYPADEEYMLVCGVCSGCVTWDKSGKYKAVWNDHQRKEAERAAARIKKRSRSRTAERYGQRGPYWNN
jgi:transcription initiation factor TFIIIB Brf1 subunit/transcription initiation factor TFIIB